MTDANTPALVFATVGGGLVAFSGYSAVRLQTKLAAFRHTTGTVIGHRVRHTRRDGRRKTFHHALVRYETDAGAYTHESSVSTSRPRRALGDSVPIVYDPAKPEDAYIDEAGEKHFVSFVLGGIGTIFVITAAWLTTLG